MGLDEAYADLTGVPKPLRVLRELIERGAREDRDPDLGRRRPEPADRQVLLGPRQARGLRGHGARGGVHPLRDRADAPAARHRPEDRRAPGRARLRDRRPAAGGRRGAARRPLRRPHGALPEGARDASTTTRRSRPSPARRSPSPPSAPSTSDIASHDELETILRTLVAGALRGPAAQGAPRAGRSRSRSGSPTGRRSRAPGRSTARRNEIALVTETALELLRAYAPPQPVRLLGVRLAALRRRRRSRRPAAPAARRRRSGPARAGRVERRLPSTGRRRACGALRARAGARRRARRARRRRRGAARPAVLRRRPAIAAISASRPRSVSPASSAANAVARAPGRPRGAGARRGPRRRRSRRRWPAASSASSRSPRRRGCGRAATAASARPGSSSSARRRSASPPARDQRVGLGGHEPVEEALDLRGRQRADELVDDLAVLERLDRRDALDAERLREARVGVRVDLDELDLARARLSTAFSSTGAERAARAAPLRPEVDDDGLLVASAR